MEGYMNRKFLFIALHFLRDFSNEKLIPDYRGSNFS